MNNPKTPCRVRCSAWLGDFVALLKKRSARLRAGCKMTVNTTTFKTNVLPTIEIKVSARRWLPLKMPDGRWYFANETERDEMLKRIQSPNDPSSATREQKP